MQGVSSVAVQLGGFAVELVQGVLSPWLGAGSAPSNSAGSAGVDDLSHVISAKSDLIIQGGWEGG